MLSDTFEELRGFLDGQDPFMTTGHQILKIRRPKKTIPSWAYSHKKIQEFLLRVFPNLEKDQKQRERAGRWVRILYLYFNQNWSRGQIASELKLTYSAVNSTIRAIKRAAAGLRSDTGKSFKKPRGRPRKNMPALKHPLERVVK